MRNYIQPGKSLSLTAPAGGVVAGQGYQVGQLFVVAQNTADAGEAFEGLTVGVFDLPKVSAQAWAEGALVYWSAAQGQCTTSATGNMPIGCAVAAAANPSANGRVRLNGIAAAAAE